MFGCLSINTMDNAGGHVYALRWFCPLAPRSRLPLRFGYSAGGQRITKVVGDPDHPTAPTGYREHYIRDAQAASPDEAGAM
jgi:hypothetical protein